MNEARFTPPPRENNSPRVVETEQLPPPEKQAQFLLEIVTDEVANKLSPDAQEVFRFIKEQ